MTSTDSTAMDPGWEPALSHGGQLVLIALFPFAIVMMAGNNLRYGIGGLTRVRRLYLASFLTLGLLVAIAAAAASRTFPDPQLDWWPVFLIPGALFEVLLVFWINRRPLDAGNEENPRLTYTAWFMLGFVFTLSIAIFGFVLVFLTGRLAPMLASLPFAVVAALFNAPTRASLVRRQEGVERSGSSLSLIEALGRGAP
ncbi:MAG: hypothetical protein ABR579_03455 [Actinomycetota bacterium]